MGPSHSHAIMNEVADPLDAAFEKQLTKEQRAAIAEDELRNKGVMGRLWLKLKQRFPDPIDLYFGSTMLIHVVVYWGSGLALLAFEKLIASEKFIQRYKIQAGKSVTGPDILKLVKVVLKNHLMLLVFYLLAKHIRIKPLVDKLRETVDRPIPTLSQILRDFIFNLGVFEVVFFASHYYLHKPTWYKQIHKIHHEFKAPIGLASEYAHPVELVLSNIVPGAIGPLIMQSHPISTWVWLSGSILMTNIHHSGFIFPWYPANSWTVAHDYHHYLFSEHFGVVGLMDNICQTTGDEDFVNYKRNAVLRAALGVVKAAKAKMMR